MGANALPLAPQCPLATVAPSRAEQNPRKATARPGAAQDPREAPARPLTEWTAPEATAPLMAWSQYREVPTDIPPVRQEPRRASTAWLSAGQHPRGMSTASSGAAQRARGAPTASPSEQLLSIHRRSLTPVLILGGGAADRAQLARAFHRESPHRAGAFVRVDCIGEQAGFAAALQDYLLAGESATGNVVHETEAGTLFLDSVACLAPHTQRLLLELVSRSPGAWNGRVIVGSLVDLASEVDSGHFLGELFDCLDKLRVQLEPAPA